MGRKSRREYLRKIKARYRKARKTEKKTILDEFCNVCGYHRKYAIELLNRPDDLIKIIRRKGPKPTYADQNISGTLKQLWIRSGYLCSKRLKAALPLWLPWYQKRQKLPDKYAKKLLKMSASTMDRYLKDIKARTSLKGRSSTKPGSMLKTQIPIQTQKWDTTVPGFLEADTVAHCGSSLAGDFAYSLDCVDIATTWTEQRAVWNKGQEGIIEALKDIESYLPFPLRGFDCDNGGEFLNHYLVAYLHRREHKVAFTRSRPYKKEDNAHIEQKNWTNVRHLFGYYRLDKPELVDMMNDIYKNEWRLLQNFFTPSVKLLSKVRIGAKYKRVHDIPKTPYQRVLESEHIDPGTKAKLRAIFKSLDPMELKDSLQDKLNAILVKLR